MVVHALFPKLLLEEKNEGHDASKHAFLQQMMKHLSEDGYSNEHTGHVTLHHDMVFAPICEMATRLAHHYCGVMRVDPDLFDFNVVKTWFNILRDTSTPYHNHADAHLSFCYYINTPVEAQQPIRFHDTDRKEPFFGFSECNHPVEWNVFNSGSWQFVPLEGTMFMWPSALPHDTIGKTTERGAGVRSMEDALTQRVTFAGDILVTYKEKAAKSMGLQPKRNWRTFSAGEPFGT